MSRKSVVFSTPKIPLNQVEHLIHALLLPPFMHSWLMRTPNLLSIPDKNYGENPTENINSFILRANFIQYPERESKHLERMGFGKAATLSLMHIASMDIPLPVSRTSYANCPYGWNASTYRLNVLFQRNMSLIKLIEGNIRNHVSQLFTNVFEVRQYRWSAVFPVSFASGPLDPKAVENIESQYVFRLLSEYIKELATEQDDFANRFLKASETPTPFPLQSTTIGGNDPENISIYERMVVHATTHVPVLDDVEEMYHAAFPTPNSLIYDPNPSQAGVLIAPTDLDIHSCNDPIVADGYRLSSAKFEDTVNRDRPEMDAEVATASSCSQIVSKLSRKRKSEFTSLLMSEDTTHARGIDCSGSLAKVFDYMVFIYIPDKKYMELDISLFHSQEEDSAAILRSLNRSMCGIINILYTSDDLKSCENIAAAYRDRLGHLFDISIAEAGKHFCVPIIDRPTANPNYVRPAAETHITYHPQSLFHFRDTQ